jgi:hypothetical protein
MPTTPAPKVDLNALLGTLQKDAQLGSPEQSVRLTPSR